MSVRKAIQLLGAAMGGFLLGFLFTRPAPVKAQSGLKVYVDEEYASVMSPGPTSIPGAQVVGFSCANDDGFIKCYTAYTK